jgi:hypothetical protein
LGLTPCLPARFKVSGAAEVSGVQFFFLSPTAAMIKLATKPKSVRFHDAQRELGEK